MYLIIPFVTSSIRFSTDPFSDIALKFLLVFGAVYGAYKSVGMLSEMFNPGAESDEAMVLGTAKKVVVGGLKLAWAAAKAILRGLYSVLTGGLGLGAAAAGTAKDAAKKVAKETAKTVAKSVKKGATGADEKK
jgi:hypothetical protein